MKKLLTSLMLVACLVSCKKDDDVQPTKGTIGTVVTSGGIQYRWSTFQNGSQTICGCYYLNSNTWTATTTQKCVNAGAGTNPCD